METLFNKDLMTELLPWLDHDLKSKYRFLLCFHGYKKLKEETKRKIDMLAIDRDLLKVIEELKETLPQDKRFVGANSKEPNVERMKILIGESFYTERTPKTVMDMYNNIFELGIFNPKLFYVYLALLYSKFPEYEKTFRIIFRQVLDCAPPGNHFGEFHYGQYRIETDFLCRKMPIATFEWKYYEPIEDNTKPKRWVNLVKKKDR